MKLSNFRPLGTVPSIKGFGSHMRKEFATVTCTSRVGPFWARRDLVEDRIIALTTHGGYWHFVDNGTYCPGMQAEELALAYHSQQQVLAIMKEA